jgi:hypothetical protein
MSEFINYPVHEFVNTFASQQTFSFTLSLFVKNDLSFCLYAPDISFLLLKIFILVYNFWKQKSDVTKHGISGKTVAQFSAVSHVWIH